MSNPDKETPSKLIFSWQEIEKDTIKVVNKIKQTNTSYRGLVVVSRGGLVVAGLIARLLDIKLLDMICIASYSNVTSSKVELEVLKNPDLARKDKGKGWLIIDDLVDSGDTYKYIIDILPLADFACLYNKSNQEASANNVFYAENCPKDSWIEFPWETIVSN